jgi:acetyltransferase
MPATLERPLPSPPASGLPEPEKITLPDGLALTIRPIRPDDAPGLQALHSRLSPETIRQRFLAMITALTDTEAHRLANVDYCCTMAFVATLESDDGRESIVGVARYARLGPDEPGRAEGAIVIEDPYQGRGLGAALYGRLIDYARACGYRELVDEVCRDNDRMLDFLRSFGLPLERRLCEDVWLVVMDLAQKTEPDVSHPI